MSRNHAAFLSGVAILTWCAIGLALTLLASLGLADMLFAEEDILGFMVGIAPGAMLLDWGRRHRRSSDHAA